MRIIISPAKKMREDVDGLPPRDLPALLPRTRELLGLLRGLALPELRKLLACNEQLAALNYQRYQEMDLERRLTPALLAYEGIQYRYMAPAVFTSRELAYVQEHLFLLSGFSYSTSTPLIRYITARIWPIKPAYISPRWAHRSQVRRGLRRTSRRAGISGIKYRPCTPSMDT